MRWRAWPWAIVLACGVTPGLARAEPVALTFVGCDRLDTSQVRALVELELHGEGSAPELGAVEPFDVEVRCDGERTELVLHGSRAARSFTLGGVPERLRARVVALAVVELSRPMPPEPEAPPALAPAPRVVSAPPAEATPAPAARRARGRLGIAPLVAALPLPGAGGALLIDLELARLLSLSLAVDGAVAHGALDRGRLVLQSYGVRLGPALSIARGSFAFALGAGARVGLLVLRGEPSDSDATSGRTVRALSTAGALFGAAWLSLSHRLVLGLAAEIDAELRRVRADVEGGGARTLSPLRVAALLGLGVRW